MFYLANILISTAVAVVATIGAYNYLPLSFIERFGPKEEQPLGATITTIASTDTLRDSRTTINDNFTNLNTDKVEVATTSMGLVTTLSNLVTVGALSSGSLTTGFTTINVAQGGTGSTTLASSSILLGNQTGAIKTVDGLGTSGQFLQSNGVNTAPTWETSAIDQAAAYTWTGSHDFTKSTTTNATTTNLNVINRASTTQLTASAIGVGVSTSTTKNVEIAGDLQVTGTSTITGGCNGCGIALVQFGTGSDNYVQVGADGYFGNGTSSATIQRTHIDSPVSGIIRNLYIHCHSIA